MLIPKGGDVHTASIYMNFVLRPEDRGQIEDYVNYICPVAGADKVLLKTDPAVAKNTLIFPTSDDARERRTRSTRRRCSTPTTRRSGRSCSGA